MVRLKIEQKVIRKGRMKLFIDGEIGGRERGSETENRIESY